MNKLKNFFRDTSKILTSQFLRSSIIKHRGLKGLNREIFIENFLTSVFPQKFVIDTGEIIDSKGNSSEQGDIIIYDEFMPAFDYGATKHFLSGGVLAHIEVKSKLNKQSLTKALNTTKSIKFLERDIDSTMSFGDPPKKIFSFIFAYDGIKKENFKKHFQEYYKTEDNIENKIDGVCMLNKYIMFKEPNKKTNQLEIKFKNAEEDTLMLFFIEIFYALQKNWAGIPDIFKYLGELNFDDF